jgi:ATP-dependent RNA helicase DeaD
MLPTISSNSFLMTFKSLGVDDVFIRALTEQEISKPTDIQKEALPILLKDKVDIVAQAQTGTGKTIAFAIPILQRLNKQDKRIQAVVVCPTRELCQQLGKHFFKLTKYSEKVFVETVFGGEPIGKQISRLRRPTQVVIATPGRLRELMELKAVDLSGIHQFVMDEADEILAMGFRKDVDKILSKTNDFRKIWLFSATIPSSLQKMIDDYIPKTAPIVRSLKKADVINPMIEHQYLICDKQEKNAMLQAFLKSMGAARGIVFVRTKGDAQTVNEQLKGQGFLTDVMHGDLMQHEREKALRAFVNKKAQILVATDMAARGLDVDNLAYVVHYNLPDQPEFYTHRSGRTARAGKRGLSLAFVTPADMKKFRFLKEKLVLDFTQVR